MPAEPARSETVASLDGLAYAGGKPGTEARIKSRYSDFRVDEELGFNPTGAGEHLYLQVSKTDIGTVEAARLLAQHCDVSMADVGYSGMKDRRGECTQWFSLKLQAHREDALRSLGDQRLQVMKTIRNQRKLRVGSHRSNRFRLLLRDCRGEHDEFEARLQQIRSRGMPNYFGDQRFGHDMCNIKQVRQLFAARPKADRRSKRRGILLSAARAYLFNQVLSERLQEDSWCRYVEGDVLNLDGTDRYFTTEHWDQNLQDRLQRTDIHISGPLCGLEDVGNRYLSRADSADMEKTVLAKYPDLVQGLRQQGLRASRRPLRCMPRTLHWNWVARDQLELSFVLPRGAYATSLLRELCIAQQPQRDTH